MGNIKAIVTFEVVGKPKEHVEQSLVKYIENITKDDRITIDHEDKEEAVEHEDGMWSAFSECELTVTSLEVLTWLSVNFSPASIEVLEPDHFEVEAREITNWFNDLLSMIHDISTNYRNQQGANEHLVLAMNQLIQNSILLALKDGSKTQDELMKKTGVADVQLEPFFEHLIKQKKIKLNADKYELA